MFDWFDKTFSRRKYPTWDDVPPPNDMEKIGQDMSKVIPFPEIKEEKKEPSVSYYRLGLTNDNRVSLQVGYSEITMSKKGVQNLIEQLQVFRDHTIEVENDTSESTDN